MGLEEIVIGVANGSTSVGPETHPNDLPIDESSGTHQRVMARSTRECGFSLCALYALVDSEVQKLVRVSAGFFWRNLQTRRPSKRGLCRSPSPEESRGTIKKGSNACAKERVKG